MPELVCELIVSLDGFARGQRSPAYFGYFGPDFADWVKTNTAVSYRQLIGRRTYESLEGFRPKELDDDWKTMMTTPGWLFSRTLGATNWPGLKIVRDDMGFDLVSSRVLDGRVLLLEYRPAGAPPYSA